MPAKILVVDDEPDLELLIRQRFRQQIRDQELQFTFASHGFEAIALLQANAEIDLVLTDINMPEMDGLTLLETLPALNPVLKALIMAAYSYIPNRFVH
jgi:CheY-like chemotaxis protein